MVAIQHIHKQLKVFILLKDTDIVKILLLSKSLVLNDMLRVYCLTTGMGISNLVKIPCVVVEKFECKKR